MTNTEEIKRQLAEFIFPLTNVLDMGDAEYIAEKVIESGLVLPSSALVRPLVWEEISEKFWQAQTPIGFYQIDVDWDDKYLTRLVKRNNHKLIGKFDTLDEAKTAAQNHFNALIGSCLQAIPETEESGIEEFDALVKKFRTGQISFTALCDGLWNKGYNSGCLQGGGAGWISVKDKMPENRQEVLCHNVHGRILQFSYEEHTEQNSEWFKKRMTHWMPLPNPPVTP